MKRASLRIAAINDVYDLKGLPRVQTFLTSLEKKPDAFVIAGDFLSPYTLASIDGGRGMVDTLRSIGLTHASIGNHEQDVGLDVLKKRCEEMNSAGIQVLNSNMRDGLPSEATWLRKSTTPYSIVQSPCRSVKVALLGLLTDEPNVFRGDKFRGVPISNVIDTYEAASKEILEYTQADLVVPVTHQSIARDKELAAAMLAQPPFRGLIIGGHDHHHIDEWVGNDLVNDNLGIRVVKSGMNADSVSLIDLDFEITPDHNPELTDIKAELVSMTLYEPSVVVQSIVDRHMSVIDELETESLLEGSDFLPPGMLLSSERTRYQQTTVGSVFCQMIKEELEVDVAMINGASIKGDKTYINDEISYSDLKKELPFPTKMVVVPMERWVLEQAIEYSRTHQDDGEEEGPRKGYLQVDLDYEKERETTLGGFDEILTVALPRNLMAGFCKIKPLMELGDELKADGSFPDEDDFTQAKELVIRYASKKHWIRAAAESMNSSFDAFDLNDDGVLDRKEVKKMLSKVLGRTPADFVVEDMISSIDVDGNGVIDHGEFSHLLASMERTSKRLY